MGCKFYFGDITFSCIKVREKESKNMRMTLFLD